jgi:hypothetical protein
MKVSPTLAFLLSACAVFLAAPYLPTALLNLMVGNYIGTAALMIATLFVLRKNIVLGIALFLAVAALFLEHRRRLVMKAQIAMEMPPHSKPASVEALDTPAPPIVKGEVHPAREEASFEDHGFEPAQETGSNSFSKVDESINEKHPLETVPPRPEEVAETMQDRGFAKPFDATDKFHA